MHKDDCIWTEPNRCNCGWLQDIAKNPCEAVREIERLRAELAACREDAERYRWLRTGKGWPAVFSGANEPEQVTGDELDAMVDYVCKGEGE